MKSTLNHNKEVRSIYLYRRSRVGVKPEMAMLMTVIVRVMMKKENFDYYDGNVCQRPVFKEIFQIHVLWFPRGRKPNLTIRDSVRQEEAIIGGW